MRLLCILCLYRTPTCIRTSNTLLDSYLYIGLLFINRTPILYIRLLFIKLTPIYIWDSPIYIMDSSINRTPFYISDSPTYILCSYLNIELLFIYRNSIYKSESPIYISDFYLYYIREMHAAMALWPIWLPWEWRWGRDCGDQQLGLSSEVSDSVAAATSKILTESHKPLVSSTDSLLTPRLQLYG